MAIQRSHRPNQRLPALPLQGPGPVQKIKLGIDIEVRPHYSILINLQLAPKVPLLPS